MATDGTARSLTEQAYTRLRADIVGGQLVPGARLRPAELAGSNGVSLNVVREALSRLAGERLVQAAPQQGFTVIGVSAADAAATAQLTARVGRARSHQQKSKGTPDPGATSFALAVSAVASSLARDSDAHG